MAIGAALLGGGCVGRSTVVPADAQGQTLDVLDEHLPPDAQLIVRDLSVLVHREPSYPEGDPAAWTVLAACADATSVDAATRVEVSVIPSFLVTDDIRSRARAGGYGDTVGDCREP